MYKIMNSELKFSNGGLYPNFTKDGKTWSSLARLHSHFSMLNEYGKLEKCYKGCRIIRVCIDVDANLVSAKGYSVDTDEYYRKMVSPCEKN